MNNCKHCNTIIKLPKKYCNADCMALDYQKNKIISNCIICNKELKSSKSTQRKYCSQKCFKVALIGVKKPEHSKKMMGRSLAKGYKHTLETRQTLSGNNSPAWKGGITDISHAIRRLPEYFQWRKSVIDRFNNCCSLCKSTDSLECHHIYSLAQIIRDYKISSSLSALQCVELWDVLNGKILCKECHKKTDTYGVNNKYSLRPGASYEF